MFAQSFQSGVRPDVAKTAKEGIYARFEKALKFGEKMTFEAKSGALTEVKITGMGNGRGKGKAND